MTTMTTTPATRHVLRVADFTAGELHALLELAEAMQQEPDAWHTTLRAQTVACYFAKPSTRTRASFETAVARLGGVPMMLRPDELQLGRGEPIADTARVLSSYSAAIVIRTFAQADVAAVAAASSVPVVNALTDEHHPCQALADLLTLKERFGALDGLRVAYVGAGTNVAHSLMEAGALLGMHVSLACPQHYQPNPGVVAWAQSTAAAAGGSVEIHADPFLAVRDAVAVYTDVWVSMGEDAERDHRSRVLVAYRVDETLMAAAASDAIFLHGLPAHRGAEVTAAVIDGPASAVWQQAANRLPTEQALLYALVTGRWS
jgi:ornithine carbamoyltransferase